MTHEVPGVAGGRCSAQSDDARLGDIPVSSGSSAASVLCSDALDLDLLDSTSRNIQKRLRCM